MILRDCQHSQAGYHSVRDITQPGRDITQTGSISLIQAEYHLVRQGYHLINLGYHFNRQEYLTKMLPSTQLWLLIFLCLTRHSSGFSATPEPGCCPRKHNNGVIYVYYDTLADPSEILAEYGCQSGKHLKSDLDYVSDIHVLLFSLGLALRSKLKLWPNAQH